jgi:hypothetical protein
MNLDINYVLTAFDAKSRERFVLKYIDGTEHRLGLLEADTPERVNSRHTDILPCLTPVDA